MGRHRTDELEDGFNPPEPAPRKKRGGSGRSRVLVPLAGAVALAVLLGVAAYVIFTRQRACTGEKLTLRVVATPDLHPAISKIATKYNQDPHPLDDRCVTVAVTKESTSKAGNGLINGKLAADLWVADSSLTVDRLRGSSGGEAVPEPAGSIARSPIVLAAAKSAATTLTKTFQPSWQGLINTANVANPNGPGRKIRVLALDPQKNAAGLSALLAAAGAARKTGLTDKQLVGALKQLSGQVVADPAALLASLTVKSGRKVPLGVATEQSVWAHNTKKPDAPVVPLYPVEGTLSLDYPIMVTAKDPTAVKAAAAFQKQLGAESARKTMRDYGFRSPDGKSGSALSTDRGFSAAAPAALEPPDGKAVASMAQSWSRLNLGTRLLALLDVSGTMVLPVPGTTMNRMQAIGKIAGEGLGLFPASSEIGVWAFSTLLQGEQDWRELVSVGPLAESVDGVLRKEALAQQLATVQAKPTGDTGLNDTLMAAYQQMKASYERDKINTILILTDGAGNDDPGGTTDAQILNYLKKEYDPKRPVNLLIIAFGPDAPKGKKQMDALAKASGGEAYIAKDVLAVRDFFLRGMSRRLCMPDCEDDS